MKLTATQIDRIQEVTGVEPVPEQFPPMEELVDFFGDHTFYLSHEGLVIWEWLEGPEADGQPVIAVILAGWTDEEHSTLAPQRPAATDFVIKLAPKPDGSFA